MGGGAAGEQRAARPELGEDAAGGPQVDGGAADPTGLGGGWRSRSGGTVIDLGWGFGLGSPS